MTDDEAEDKWIKDMLRHEFDSSIAERFDRSVRVPVGSLGPSHHFAAPTVECRKMFIAGHFFGCVSLVQAVAEAIARFLLSKNPKLTVSDPRDHAMVVNALQRDRQSPVITPKSFEAFMRIRGPRKGKEDRNVFHHLDADIELDPQKLEARAEQCLRALHEIESEVFGFSVKEGRVVLNNPEYWDVDRTTGMVRVMVRG